MRAHLPPNPYTNRGDGRGCFTIVAFPLSADVSARDAPDLAYHAKTRQRSSKMHKPLERAQAPDLAWPSTPRVCNPHKVSLGLHFGSFRHGLDNFVAVHLPFQCPQLPTVPGLRLRVGKHRMNRCLSILPALAHPSRHKGRLRLKQCLVAAGNPNRRRPALFRRCLVRASLRGGRAATTLTSRKHPSREHVKKA